jgi:ribosomal protein S12 methylthiotransferase accessory factor
VNRTGHVMPNPFTRAAALLLRDIREDGGDPDARLVLEALGYADRAGIGLSGPENRHRAHLLMVASRFVRVFELAAPEAPGLVCFGAEIDPATADPMHAGSPSISVSGVGVSLQEAFQGCIGEGIEYLSQLQTERDVLKWPDCSDPAASHGPLTREFLAAFAAYRQRPDLELSWLRAMRLADRSEVWLPADLCLRRPPDRREIRPPFPLSTGSAAGTSLDAAALHGLLELIERDAASLWWWGGHRGRSIPPEHQAHIKAHTLLARLRQNASARRRSWLLDITTDVGIPCVAAISCMVDGFGFAFGLAARPTLSAAASAAVIEMCQGELAYAVVEAKCRERGEAALNEKDRVHRRRATMINADQCLLLQPVAEPAEHLALDATDADAMLHLIVKHLERFGIETFTVNLTRAHIAVPAVRVIAPGLQLEPSEIVMPRLADMMVRTGGGAMYTGGVALM